MQSLGFYIDLLREQEKVARRPSAGLAEMRRRQAEEVARQGYYTMPATLLEAGRETIHVALHPLPQNNNPRQFLHRHDYFELMYVYRGSCENRFESGSVRMSEGEMMLLNPNTSHCPVTTEQEDCLFNLLISRNLFQQSFDILLGNNQMFSSFFSDCLTQPQLARAYLHFMPDDESIAVVERLIVEFMEKSSCYQEVMQALLVQLCAYLARSSRDCFIQSETRQGKLLSGVLSQIQRDPARISLQTLADRFGYSTAYLSRFIKAHTGKNFTELLRETRVARAEYYLDHTDIPIAQIALMLGFSDVSHFYGVFRARCGCTPLQRRASAQVAQPTSRQIHSAKDHP